MTLEMCKSIHKPKDGPPKNKKVQFGDKGGKMKTLILDMDETMLHAKFIHDDAELEKDDGNFVFTL